MSFTRTTHPLISIVIATYNSEKTLEKTLKSLRKQNYPQSKIEILVIDGGSNDKTISIAKRYKCNIFPNLKTELIYAKHIGFLKAKGKYLLYLDSDEVLESHKSLTLKLHAFIKNRKVKASLPTGYKSPLHESPINDYVNEFGDPFSFFVYRESKGYKFLIKDFSKRFTIIDEDKECLILDFTNAEYLPLIELWAGGCMIDLQYIKRKFPQTKRDLTIIPHLYYLLIKNNNYLAITKHDNTIHYSCESVKKYLKKLGSRIKNNVFVTPMGKGGFEGREKFQPSSFHMKKYLFILYSLFFVFPLWDSFILLITRKKIVYLLHWFLCLYTASFILFYYSLKFLKINPKINTYGN